MFSDLLGAMMESGMTRPSGRRVQHALSAGGTPSEGALSGLLGGLGDSLPQLFGSGGGGLGGMLGDVLGDASGMLGGKQNLALGGLGALAGAVLGGGGGAVKGALGGGVMALLGALAFSALKKTGNREAEVPLGLREPASTDEEKELEHDAELVFRAMVNAAKADGRIDERETQRIVGKLGEMGIGSEARDYVLEEMNKPMDTDNLVNAAARRPDMAARLYAASLLAIEVDTPNEREYMKELRSRLGVPSEAAKHIEDALGVRLAF
jgi:uncharacterized membrane protein YebE (DUF533 family)